MTLQSTSFRRQVCLMLVTLAVVVHTSTSQGLLESCRKDGFDPWQLSCETCEILPTSSSRENFNPHQRCLECCQSYKTSERMTKPYESAVLVHRETTTGGDSEMAQFLNEHWDELVKTKGAKRLIKMEQDSAMASRQFLFFRPAPQMVLWFDELVPPGRSVKEYKEKAKEIVTLDGYKKDDMKDMLTTLLPDKK